MQRVLKPSSFYITIFIFILNPLGLNAAPKSFFKSVSAQFYLSDPKTLQNFYKMSFDGRFAENLTSSIEKIKDKEDLVSGTAQVEAPVLKCEFTAQFTEVRLKPGKTNSGVQIYLISVCDENNQKITTRHGRILVSDKDILSFKKVIFLTESQPRVLLKVKDLSY